MYRDITDNNLIIIPGFCFPISWMLDPRGYDYCAVAIRGGKALGVLPTQKIAAKRCNTPL